MKEKQTEVRIQLDNGYAFFVLFIFFVVPLFLILQSIVHFDDSDFIGALLNIIFILFLLMIAYRIKDIKKVSFDSTNFYIKSIFKRDEISVPINRVTSFKKAFIFLQHTDMFLIRYTDYNSQQALVKIVRHRDHISIVQFRELVEKNEPKADHLRGIVENKF